MLKTRSMVFCAGLLGACAATSHAPALHYVGRINRDDRNGPILTWSASSFEGRFRGSHVAFELHDLIKTPDPEGRMWPNRYQVMLDDRVEQVFVPAQGVSWSATLPFGEHRLKVFKQAEALVGDSQVTSVRIDGEWLETPRPTLRIEFVGDSLSTGYGNEGPNRDCHFSEATQNQWLAYPSLVARALNAEHTVIAWSGKGVIRNYEDPRGGTPPEVTERDRLTVPQLYARTHPERQPAPDIVVVALGANDFSARDPGEEAFVAGYWALLQSIKTTYPKARMLAVVPPIEDGWPPGQPSLTLARKYIRAALLADTVLVDLPRADPTDGLGCDWHPSLARHKKIAEAVVRALAPGER